MLLVDGQAYPEHGDQRHAMTGGHDIVHEIGGEDDTNSNTTRRVLLLLESLPIGNREAYDRVRCQILSRYLRDDRGLVRSDGTFRVPRFLLNDLTRYWRTVTVDFVYKQRAEGGEKWALRNAKLRMSRKLVFASGLLRCFFCHLDPAAAGAREALAAPQPDMTKLLTYLESELAQTPLELLARASLELAAQRATARKLFDSYDRFLSVLDNSEKREVLADVSGPEVATSAVWKEIRDLSHDFHSGLVDLFFGQNKALRELTIHYGLF